MKGIETMVSVNHAANNSQNQTTKPPKMHWRHMDILRWCDDTTEAKNVITVTPGKPSRMIWRTHEYCRALAQVKPLIDAGYIEYLRTEIYTGGESCEIYITSKKGRAAVEAYYNHSREKNAERYAAIDAKREAEQKELNRLALTSALTEQYGNNFYIPALLDDITNSRTPFLNVPMPRIAPTLQGEPVTIKTYLINLWYDCLDDDGQKKIINFFKWGDAIGYEDAAAMLMERDDEADDGSESPYGQIS